MVTRVEARWSARSLPPLARSAMVDDRIRRHQDSESGQLRSPTEIEIRLEAVTESAVGRSDLGPHGARDQHRARRDEPDLADSVVLSLIDLAFFQRRIRITEPIGGESDPPKDPRVLPVEHLWTDHARSHLLGGLDQAGHGLRGEHRVVVEEQKVVGVLRNVRSQRFRHRDGEASVAREAHHAAGTQGRLEEIRRTV